MGKPIGASGDSWGKLAPVPSDSFGLVDYSFLFYSPLGCTGRLETSMLAFLVLHTVDVEVGPEEMAVELECDAIDFKLAVAKKRP